MLQKITYFLKEEYPEKQRRRWKDNITSDRKPMKMLNWVQWWDMSVVYLMTLASSSDVATNDGIRSYTVI